ncbi:hypothetical protein [Streptomyces acidicola]|uniref:hypothetical protein n=1 Tax=Streptomyces acidicola TaxID=2596892 RepID=UPI0037FFA71D
MTARTIWSKTPSTSLRCSRASALWAVDARWRLPALNAEVTQSAPRTRGDGPNNFVVRQIPREMGRQLREGTDAERLHDRLTARFAKVRSPTVVAVLG